MEQVAKISRQPVANPLKRILVGLLDLVVVALGCLLISLPAILVLVQAIKIEGPYTILGLYLIAAITGAGCVLFGIFYHVFLPYRFRGQTLGNAIMGTRIAGENGEDPNLVSLLVRASVLVVLEIFTFGLYYLAEAFCLVLTKAHTDMTDLFSSTCVSDFPIKEDE